MLRKSTILCLILFIAFSVYGEKDKLKMFRIQGKLGIPNLAGVSVGFVLPIVLGSVTIGVDADLTHIPLPTSGDIDNASIDYYSGSPTLYFSPYGKKLFLGLGFGRLSVSANKTYYHSYEDPTTLLPTTESASAKASLGANCLLMRCGYRWIWGPITLALESGLVNIAIDEEIKVKVKFPSGTIIEYTEKTEQFLPPGSKMSGTGLIFGLSLGLAF